MPNQVVYGFHALHDRFGQSATAAGVEVVNDAITQAMAEHNRQLGLLTDLFVQRGMTGQQVFRTPQVTRNQPLDEYGRPIPIRGAARYTVGYPLIQSGNALGYTWQASLALTVGQINDVINTIQVGDMRWVFDHILAAFFAASSYSHFDAEAAGDLTVLPLANGDAQTYQMFAGTDNNGTDNHLLAQLNAIGAGADNPFPTIYSELMEHPENGNGQVIAFVPTNLKASIMALATFNPLPNGNIRLGANSDELVGRLGVATPGTLLGMEDSGVWIVEWPRLPSGYMMCLNTGGPAPIGERSSDLPELQGGLIELPRNEDFPWYQRQWMRANGYGAYNRVGGLVYRIGNASYAVPTNYASPMP